MQLTLSQPLILFLALAAPLAVADADVTTLFGLLRKHDARSITDKVKGAIGDPTAIVSDMPPCMRICAATYIFTGTCEFKALNGVNASASDDETAAAFMQCACSADGGSADGGASWDNFTQSCFPAKNGDAKLEQICKGQKYQAGKLQALCKAAGNSTDKAAKVVKTLASEAAKDTEALQNGTGGSGGKGLKLKSGAAAGFGRLDGLGVGMLAAAVGFAVAML